jgi:hypothetical protein
MPHQVKVVEVIENPDGSARLLLEFDDETKQFLMNLWGISEWDEERAQVEFLDAIKRATENENATQEEG